MRVGMIPLAPAETKSPFFRPIAGGTSTKGHPAAALRHPGHVAGWKWLEPRWDRVGRTRHALRVRPALEQILLGFGRQAEWPAEPRRTPEPAPRPTA